MRAVGEGVADERRIAQHRDTGDRALQRALDQDLSVADDEDASIEADDHPVRLHRETREVRAGVPLSNEPPEQGARAQIPARERVLRAGVEGEPVVREEDAAHGLVVGERERLAHRRATERPHARRLVAAARDARPVG